MTFIFDYNTFINYYNNSANILIDTATKPNLFYYKNLSAPNQIPETKIWPKKYIIIGGTQIFIEHIPKKNYNDEFYFTIPTYNNNKFWDDHYHFGIRNIKNFKTRLTSSVIFFHKSTQNPIKNGKDLPINCYFQNQLKIEDIESIICQQASATLTMGKQFASDLGIIKEIISRPFLGIQYGGLFKHIKIYFGKKGGIYIIKNYKKKYLLLK
jgi:hypothetical protein